MILSRRSLLKAPKIILAIIALASQHQVDSSILNTLYIAFFILKVARFFFLEDAIIDIQTLIERHHSVEQSWSTDYISGNFL